MADDWPRVEALFSEAVTLTAEERSAFLDRECGDDRRLRRQVESLLAADDSAGSFLDPPDGTPEPPAPLGQGDAIGRYRVLRRLGQGGMATVYLAVRERDYRQRVAVKVFHGAHRPDLLRRFRQERQILASLEHPSIARLLDGGTTGDGLTYLVMELVEGEPIDVFCDRRGLSVDQRVDLFRRLVEVVHFAHQRLVVHRDLKPRNVLVTADGTPKLLDFGIAKLVEDDDTEAILLTAPGQRLMTPAYASPEQIRSGPITTATDVYSMGVLLYLLLTGRLPYRARGAVADLERAILETEPERPSAAVSPDRVRGVAGRAASEVRRQLEGDLDNILLKALRKEPTERYGSVEQLGEDLRRYREGLPVSARPETFSYLARKFLRRRWREMAAATVVVALVVGFLADRELQQRRTVRERDRAEQAASLLVELFEVFDPREAGGDPVTSRAILDRGAERIAAELGDQPELQATLWETIGKVYGSLGFYDAAAGVLEQALALRRDLAGRRSLAGGRREDLADCLDVLAMARRGQGDYPVAEVLLREALAVRDQLTRPRDSNRAETLHGLALVLRDQGRYEPSEEIFRQALALKQQFFGEEHVEVAGTLVDLAKTLEAKGDYSASEPVARRALAMRRRLLPDSHPDVAESLSYLAELLRQTGDFASAEPLAREAVAIHREVYGDHHPSLADALSYVAILRHSLGDYAQSAELYRQALAIYRRGLGEEHPWVATTMHNLAIAHWQLGDLEAAEPLARQALAMRRRFLGGRHPTIPQSINLLGMLRRAQGQGDEAEALLREAVAVGSEIFDGAHRSQATGLNNLATVLSEQGRTAEAEATFRRALAMRRQLFGDEHSEVAITASYLAALLVARGEIDAAEELAREAVRVTRAKLPAGHWKIAHPEHVLGACRLARGDYAEAETLLLASYERLLERRTDPLEVRLEAPRRLVRLYEAWGRPAEAARFRELTARSLDGRDLERR